MARRLEATYSKKAILSVYLNHIYLGAGACGVAAAAQRYFQKDLEQLDARRDGADRRPRQGADDVTRRSSQPELAIERRDVVLDKMARYGFADRRRGRDARRPSRSRSPSTATSSPDRMPYYAEHVRRYVDRDATARTRSLAGGLRIETAAEPTWDAAAYDNTDFGARNQDKRQGWRGPEWRVDGAARDVFVAAPAALYGAGPLGRGRRYLALVDKVARRRAPRSGSAIARFELPLRNMRWAAPWSRTNAENDHDDQRRRPARSSPATSCG